MNPVSLRGLRAVDKWSPIGASWLQALYLVSNNASMTFSGATVTKWNDLSGLGRHATISGGGTNMPYIASDSRANGLPAIGPSDTSLQRSLVTPSITASRTYMVASYKAGTESTFEGYSTILSGPGNFGEWRIIGTISTAQLLNDRAFAFQFSKNGAAQSATVLPMPLSVLMGISGTPRTQLYYIMHEASRSFSWPGACRAFVLTDGTESDADRDRLVGYLAHDSNIQSSLVASHPYRVQHP